MEKSAEFFNRIDKVVVFNPLTQEHLREILDHELQSVSDRLSQSQPENKPFAFQVMPSAVEFLLLHGNDKRYNARHLKRSVQVNLVHWLAGLIASKQVNCGDYIEVEHERENESLSFFKVRFQNSSLPAGESVSVENVA